VVSLIFGSIFLLRRMGDDLQISNTQITKMGVRDPLCLDELEKLKGTVTADQRLLKWKSPLFPRRP
jgi:hypothetical protein